MRRSLVEMLEPRALLDAVAPVSQVEELEDESGIESFVVNWSGADEPDGSGLAGFDVLVSINGGAYVPWLLGTTETSATYDGAYGEAYDFYSIAYDIAGNVEAAPLEPDAGTFVVPTWISESPGSHFAISPAGETRTLTVDQGTITLTADAAGFMPELAVIVTGDSRIILEASQHFASLDIAHADAEVVVDAGRECYLHTTALSIQPGGYLDLNDNAIIVDYNENDANPFSQIQQWVLTGYATSGSAPKDGIISGTGRSSDGLTILALTDFAENAPVEWPLGSGNTFNGRAVLGTQVYFGDLNLDGRVTGDDYANIDSNLGVFPPVGTEWTSGDANLDSAVTGDDYATVDSNMGLSLPPDWLKVPWDARFTLHDSTGQLPTFSLIDGEATFAGNVAASNPGLNVSVGSGATLVLDMTQRLGRLTVAGGGRIILPPGGDNHLVVEELLLSPGATINVSDNDLIVQKGSLQQIADLVFGGYRDQPDPAATGIVSTLSQRGGGNALSVLIDNRLLNATQWKGGALGPDAVIATYTMLGDVNLDGKVTADDYAVIDSNLETDPAFGIEWLSGDSNLDGVVTADDYATLDATLGAHLPRGAHNTGPTDRGALVFREPFTVRQDGAVIENVHVIGGKIEIAANNVTIRNFIIEANVTVAIKIHGGFTGTVIEDGEITGPNTTNGVTGSNYIARRLHIHHMGADAFRVARNVIIEDCYVHDVGIKPESHGDIVQMYPLDGTNITIRGNHFDARGGNAALFQVENGWHVENNYLNGGNYTVYGAGEAATAFINNIFGRDFRYGAIRIGRGDESLLTWQGNIYHETGAPVSL